MLVATLQALEVATRGAGTPLLARRLRDIHRALQNRSLEAALTLIDRTWRSMPDAATTLAPIYGRLLSLEDTDADAALRVLTRVDSPDADVVALTARSFLRLRRSDDARHSLDSALRSYCVTPQGLLAQEASGALQSLDLRAAGWVGLSQTLEFFGELAPGQSPSSIRVTVRERPVEPSLHGSDSAGRARFSFPMPVGMAGDTLLVTSEGIPLLGSGLHLPVDFKVDGRSDGDGRRISGWARIGWAPTQPVRLRFEDEHGAVVIAHTRTVPLPGSRWPFDLNLRDRGLSGDRIEIRVRLPDGRWQPLPDTPLLQPRAVRLQAPIARLPRWRKNSTPITREPDASPPCSFPIDIVIPVYRGRRETLACIESVLSTAGNGVRVIVVDDATPDATLAAALDELAVRGRIKLLRNESNLGFVHSVNRAIAMNAGGDLVLLNSDTVVFGDWLQRLRSAAYSAARVGTVTPFSNDGSITSYPRRFGGAIGAEEAAALHELAASTLGGVSAEIPVGVGFCLYLRQDCLQEVGDFDATAFAAGYGEESDFCLRARARGWSHRIAADAFVYHAGGGSFGPRRAALLDRSQRLLNLRHPGYDRFISEFLRQDPLMPLRRRLDERRLVAHRGRFVLLVSLALTGGVERFVEDRKKEIRTEGAVPVVLKPQRPGDARNCELTVDDIDVPNLRYRMPTDLAALTALLTELRLERTEIQHFLDLNPAVIEALRSLDVPYEVMIHDYAWICPRITLIDGSGRYCGEPAVSICESCVRKNGTRLAKSLTVSALRARSQAWLAGARAVYAPSHDTARRLKRHFPQIDIGVRPHRASANIAPNVHSPRRARAVDRLRIGLIGAIGSHKGYRVLLECARDAAARNLPLEFVVVGYTENDRRLLRTGKVEVTGRYVDAEVPHLLRREQPDLVFLPSVWPETWCYALDHALAAGLPTVAFDLGAIAERLHAGPHSLLSLDLEPREINTRLLEIGEQRNRARYVQSPRMDRAAVTNIEKRTDVKMPTPAEASPDEGLSASLQVLPLLPGLYLFSVTSATPATDRARGALRLPAMHVGLGPGVRSDQVEFVAGPNTDGAWLFARGDVLVARINGTGATLVLTSVRATNGDVLSIEVERLESRGQTGQAVAVTEQPVVHLPPAAAAASAELRTSAAPPHKPAGSTNDGDAVPLQIKTHIRARGDINFADTLWAGRVAPGLWMESFSVLPLRHLGAHDVEYKGLTGTGFETPWVSDDQNCGTKGMSVPLVGFAVRLKPSTETAAFDCEYSGYFQSGTIVGPLRNGAPCRSTVANDPLEGIQLRFVRRANSAAPSSKSVPLAVKADELYADVAASQVARALKRGKADGGVKVDPGLRTAPRT